jgi:hypothetical protein
MLTRRAPIGASSYNPETRTALAVLASEAPILRTYGRPDGRLGTWREVLTAAGADLSRAAGASILVDHRNSARERIGVIDQAAAVGSEIHARLRFSGRAEIAPILEDVCELGSQLSVGYNVASWEGPDDARAEAPTFRATAWQLLEASLVAVAADPSARVRSMDPIITNPVERRAEPEANPILPLPGADGATAERQVQERVSAELERCARIRKACTFAKISAAIGEEMIRQNIAADVAVSQIIDSATQRDAAAGIMTRVGGADDWADPDAIARRMQGALLHRADPGRYPLAPEAAEFRGCSLVELRRRLLEASGINARGWTPDRVLGYRQNDGWLGRGGGGFMTTSDLPSLLTGTGQRILEELCARRLAA